MRFYNRESKASRVSNKYNPFRPDKICPPGIFAGRIEELKIIDHCLMQTLNGNPQHFIVKGEKGIGKSSIIQCERFVAEGSMPVMSSTRKLNFVVMDITLEESDDFLSIIRKIAHELRRQFDKINPSKKYVSAALDFISQIEAFGVRFNRDNVKRDEIDAFSKLQDDFVTALSQVKGFADGIVLLIDEADKPAGSAVLGRICKLLTEEITKSNNEYLCIGLAGLPTIMDSLLQSHESSLRIFRTLDLKPLERLEIFRVIESGLKEASSKNQCEITITEQAKNSLAVLSEGYPHFIQEFAYCAFEKDEDNVIDNADVIDCLYEENGAFDQLGQRYFNQYYGAVSSEDYRRVLYAMSDHLDDWVSRADIRKESKLKASTVDNALRALRAKNVIVLHDFTAGLYRLPSKSFSVWLKIKRAESHMSKASDEGNLFSGNPKDILKAD